jgi:hypothetical protein
LRFSVAILAQVDWLNRPAEEAAFQLGPASLPDPWKRCQVKVAGQIVLAPAAILTNNLS